jgi:hypothetical protein
VSKAKKSRKTKGPKEVKGKEMAGRSNLKVRINEETGDEDDEQEAGAVEPAPKRSAEYKKMDSSQKATKKKI